MEKPGRPSVVRHLEKSVHTDGSPFRKDGENIHQPPAKDPRAKDDDNDDYEPHHAPAEAGSAAGAGGGSFLNPPFKPSPGMQTALYIERQTNRRGRPALK